MSEPKVHQGKLTDAQCAEIATWVRGIAALGSLPRVIVDRGMTPGQPIRDDEAERLYVHPEDYLALQRWDHRHGQLWV